MTREKSVSSMHLHIRIQPEQDKRWREAAARKGEMFSRYVKSTLDKAANADLGDVVEGQSEV